MQHLNCDKHMRIIIPGNGGIPGWVLHQEIGSQVRIELPLNWYEDNHFLGFAFFYLYQKENHSEASCDASDELRVTLYPKNAIPKKYRDNQPRNFLAAFDFVTRISAAAIKRSGIQLIYTHDYLHNNVPKLLDHQRGDDDDAQQNQADDQEPRPKRLRASNTQALS